MSTANASTESDDVWEQLPPDPSVVPLVKARASATFVRDSWDDDDDEEEGETPQALWENANKKAPMPELIISASGTTTALSPPPAAFQPVLKILQRPIADAASSSTAPLSPDAQNSYAEREARYQAARQRIFNGSAAEVSFADTQGRAGTEPRSLAPADVKIIRAPRGPPTDNATSASTSFKPSRGFKSKRGGRGAPRG